MQRRTSVSATRSGDLLSLQRTNRLAQAADWLIQGVRPKEAVIQGCAAWGVQKRMAQLYVACARKELQAETDKKNLRFELHLLAQQRCIKA